MMKQGKNIPKAIEIEEAVLGAMIVDSKSVLEAMPILKSGDMFFDPDNQIIFKALQNLYQRNDSIDILSVGEEVKVIHGSEMTMKIVELSTKIASGAHTELHCRLLVQSWIKRQLIKKCTSIISNCYKPEKDCFDLLEFDAKANDEIQEIVFSSAKSISYADALTQVEKRVEMLSSKKENEVDGIPTGYAKIDRFTGGWQPTDLIIIGARPGMGKTALALKTVVECGKQNYPIGFFSLEMSAQQLAARTIAINSNLHLGMLIRDGFEKPKYFVRLREKTTEMKEYPVFIDDTPSLDISDLLARARIWKRKHGIKIIIVDYLQLVTDHTKSGNREQEISSISRNLKKLAKELNVPVLALSQLSRKIEERVDKRPRLSDLRESGAIEQDADIVTFLYRPEYYNQEVPQELVDLNANAELSFAKYREGSLETKGLYWDANKTKYMDPDEYKSSNDLPNVDPKTDTPF